RAGSLLLRIGKHAQSFELCFTNESEERLKAGVGFAGETHDESRTQGDPRNALSNLVNQLDDILLRSLPAHPFEHVLMDVLQRDVHVSSNLRGFGDGLNQFLGPMRRMRVKE